MRLTEPVERLHRELARTSCAGLQRRIERQLRNIQRRALHRLWLRDPTAEGRTLELSSREEDHVRAFLRDELGLNIDLIDHVTGRFLTARAADRARWAGYLCLAERCSREAARLRVAGLLRDERRFWARKDVECEVQ
jgi:hypothetical protein